jgi:hypothetical protein
MQGASSLLTCSPRRGDGKHLRANQTLHAALDVSTITTEDSTTCNPPSSSQAHVPGMQPRQKIEALQMRMQIHIQDHTIRVQPSYTRSVQ